MEQYVIPSISLIMVVCLYLICRTDSYTKKVHKSLKDMTKGRPWALEPPSRQPSAFPIKYDNGKIMYRTPTGNIVDRVY